MPPQTPLRPIAQDLLEHWTAGESLRKHALSVSICCEAYARLEALRLNLDAPATDVLADLYAATGLLHDMDYERHPTPSEHPFVAVAYLREQGWPEDILHAILAHADYSGTLPESHLDRTLFACDELAGFLTACTLVRPSRLIAEVEVASVVKKLKDKAFARAVNRADITRGAELLNCPVADHIATCLHAMQARHAELGL